MAVTKITPTKIEEYNKGTTTPTSTLVGANGADLLFTGKDHRILIMVDTADITVKAGNGIQGVTDLTVKSGESVVLESGFFKNVSGEHKGTVHITGATAKITAIELP